MSRVREETRFGEDKKKQENVNNIINQSNGNRNNNNNNNNDRNDNDMLNNTNIQKRLLDEINMLKNSRPYSTSKDLEKLKKENESLIQENKQLKSIINDQAVDLSGNPNENPKNLRNKISFLEKTILELEKERTGLSVRCIKAEQELEDTQIISQGNIQKYQKKVLELTKWVNIYILIINI